jgi:hypothetical protein
MDAKKAAAKHDEQRRSPPILEAPEGRTYGRRQPEYASEPSPPPHRYLGNSYVHAMATKEQRVGLQTKLKVNEPGDSYEREADRVADQVLATPAQHDISGAPPRIQRFSGQSHGQVDGAPASVDQALASSGKPLEPALRHEMEERFGYDFSRVRVHSGAAAEQSARDVNAEAYTLGHDIVFDTGQFTPETTKGRQLIAHELTHVVQQTGCGAPFIQRKEKKDEHDMKTVTQITVEAKTTGEGKGRALTSDGATYQINLEVNNLSPSRIITGGLMGEPDSHGWSRIHLGSMSANFFVYLLPPGVTLAQTVTILVEPPARERAEAQIRALKTPIRDFLTREGRRKTSEQDLLKAASAGRILERAGVTEDELLLLEQRRIDRKEVGLPPMEGSDLEDWALSYLGSRLQAKAAEQANATTLLQTTERLSLASLNLYQQDPLLELIEPESRLSALATDNAIRFKETHPMHGQSEKVETPFRDLGDLRRTLQTFENALVPDLRVLATSFLDDTEVRLLRMQHQFVGRGDKQWGPGYLEQEIEKIKQDPDVIKVQKEHEELTQAIDQEQQEDDQLYRENQHIRWWADLYDKRKKERQDKREKEQQRYEEALRQTVTRKSKLKLSPGSDVSDFLFAKSGRRAQVMLTDFIVDGRAKVREAREKLSDAKFLYAADIVVNKEKEFLSQALAAGSDCNRYPEGTLEHAFCKGFVAKRWNTVNWIIDKLARERRAQTTIWQDIWKVFEFAANFIPGPIGWATRFAVAAVDFDKKISTARDQSILHNTGISSVAPNPNAASSAVLEFGVQVLPDAALSIGATKGATSVTLGLEKNLSRSTVDATATLGERQIATAAKRELAQVGDEAARVGEHRVTPAPANQAAKRPVTRDVPKKPMEEAVGAGAHRRISPVDRGRGARPFYANDPKAPRRPGGHQPSQGGEPPRRSSPTPPPERNFDERTEPEALPFGASPEAQEPPRGMGVVSGETGRQVETVAEGEIEGAQRHLKDLRDRTRQIVEDLNRRPAGPRQVHPRVIPGEGPVPPSRQAPSPQPAPSLEPAPSPPPAPPAPEVAPPAPPHQVHPRVLPREGPVPPPRQVPSPQPAPSPEPEPPPVFEDIPTGVRPGAQRGEVVPSEGARQVGSTAEGEIATSGSTAVGRSPAGEQPAESVIVDETLGVGARKSPEPQTGSPQPVREPAVSGETSVQAPVSKTPQKLERFDFRSLPVPEQYRNARDKVQVFGTEVINWGSGPESAQGLTTMLRTNPQGARAYMENLRRVGVTREMARAWADFYRHEHQRAEALTRTHRVPMNKTPQSRVTLMDLIADLL